MPRTAQEEIRNHYMRKLCYAWVRINQPRIFDLFKTEAYKRYPSYRERKLKKAS